MEKNYFHNFMEKLYSYTHDIEATIAGGKPCAPEKAFDKALGAVKDLKKTRRKAIFIGNGGSAAIASHQAVDYWKNGGIRAVSFNDAAGLTCISNDYGYEYVFRKPIEMFAEKGDVLFAISSSGQSPNVLNGVKAAMAKRCFVITLSGFSRKNALRRMGSVNFYVPSSSYGVIEIAHLAVCHSILDFIIEPRKE